MPLHGRREVPTMAASKHTSANFAVEAITRRILVVRKQKVILDTDLAALYHVETRVLNQAIKRNQARFPADFMFQLSPKEFQDWRSQIVMSNSGAKMGLRRRPFAFTEHGALMAATVLSSVRAVETSIFVVRAFLNMREALASHKDLARKLVELERRVDGQDDTILEIFDAIKKLLASPPPEPKRRPIGFVHPK